MVVCGVAERPAPGEAFEAGKGRIEDGGQQVFICGPGTVELRDPSGIKEKASDTKRIVRDQTSSLADASHVADLGREVRTLRFPDRRLKFAVGDEPVERVVLTHRRDERPGEVDAHLPVHPLGAGGGVGERGMGDPCKFHRPPGVSRFSGLSAHPVERMHPLRQVMVVLPVPPPFQPFVERLIGPSFGKRFSDPEGAPGRVRLALLIGKTADPPGPRVVVAVPAEGMVYLVDEAEGKGAVGRIAGPAEEFEVVADRISVRPEVAPRRGVGRVKPGQAGELRHEVPDNHGTGILRHPGSGYRTGILNLVPAVTYGGGAHRKGMGDAVFWYAFIGAMFGMVIGQMFAGLPGVIGGIAVGAVAGWYLGQRPRG